MEMDIHFPEGQKVNAMFDDFEIKTDQSIYAGGTGEAPDPFSLFLSSIGTCTGVYVLRFCQKRNIPTDTIHLNLKAKKNIGTELIDNIDITIHAGMSFPKKYKDAILRVASQCTVKKHLEKPPSINICFSQEE